MSLNQAEVPSTCFAICNNAFDLAINTGKNSALCSSSSPFLADYSACLECADSASVSDKTYITDSFAQYLDSCESGAPLPTFALPSPDVYYATNTLTTPTTITTNGTIETIITALTTVTTVPVEYHFYTLDASIIITSLLPSPVFGEIAASVASAASIEGIDGDATSLLYSALITSPIPSWFLYAIPSAYTQQIENVEAQIQAITAELIETASNSIPSSTNPPTTTPTLQPTAGKSNAWIAGPVVGSVVGIILIALGSVLASRRRKRTKISKQTSGDVDPIAKDKPELHSDSRAVYELGDHQARPEMAGNEIYWELPANERSLELPIDVHTGGNTATHGGSTRRA